MFTSLASRQKNDCAPVAIANWFNEDYESVCKAIGYLTGKGTFDSRWIAYVQSKGMVEMPVPRRGQEKMTGLIKLCSRGSVRSRGHLAIIVNGLVYDAFADGMPIREYTLRCRTRINRYFIGKQPFQDKSHSEPKTLEPTPASEDWFWNV